MMSPLSSITPSGTAAARLQAGAGTGDPMASAFAMLFALMPGMGDATAGADNGDGQPKAEDGMAQDGGTSEKDGKDLPSDAVTLPVMPVAVPPLPLPAPEPAAPPAAATGPSAAPITAFLAAMPTLPDSGASPAPAPVAMAADPKQPPVSPAMPVAFDPLKGTMPVPPAMSAPMTGDADPATPVTIRPDASTAMAAPTARGTGPALPIEMRGATRTTISALATQGAGSALPIEMRADAPIVMARADAPTAMTNPAGPDTARTIPITTRADMPTIMIAPAAHDAVPAAPLAIRGDVASTTLSSGPMAAMPARQDMPLRFAVTSASAPVVAPLPIAVPAPLMQPGQTAPALELFGLARRAEQGGSNPLTDRRQDEAALSVDATTLTRADSLTAAPVLATTGAEQAPLDMTQAHWPQAMIDRIDRMREDAATADTRIQLSPDALGGIAVNLRHEGGATHIHFTADQAQTATLLADAQPTLARLAEEKGMRLGQTAVDMGQSGAGGERQAPPRRPDPVQPTRPAFAAATPSSDAGDTAAASTRIA
jgi:hypothetical protein